MVIVGSEAFAREDADALLSAVASLCRRLKSSNNIDADWKVLNVLHKVINKFESFEYLLSSEILQRLYLLGCINFRVPVKLLLSILVTNLVLPI